MENSIPDALGSFQIFGDAVWAGKCPGMFVKVHSACSSGITEHMLLCLCRQYLDFVEDAGGTSSSCKGSTLAVTG